MLVRILLRRCAVIAVIISLFVGVPAMAAPPLPDASIWVEQPESSKLAALETPVVPFGESVSFGYELSGKVAKNSYLTVGVVCWQGDLRVYTWYGQPDYAFPLIDQVYDPTPEWDGVGDPYCRANLKYHAGKRVEVIAQTWFDVDM